jgi:hypothetical protein
MRLGFLDPDDHRQVHLRHTPSSTKPAVSRREMKGSYTFLWAPVITRLQAVECEHDRGTSSEHGGVCDDQCVTARKLLILKTERCPSG